MIKRIFLFIIGKVTEKLLKTNSAKVVLEDSFFSVKVQLEEKKNYMR